MTKLSRAKHILWLWLSATSLIPLAGFAAARSEVVPPPTAEYTAQRLAFAAAYAKRAKLNSAELDVVLKAMGAYPGADLLRFQWLVAQISADKRDDTAIAAQRALLVDEAFGRSIDRRWRAAAMAEGNWPLALRILPAARDCQYLKAYAMSRAAPNFGPLSGELFVSKRISHGSCNDAFERYQAAQIAIPASSWQARAAHALERQWTRESELAVPKANDAYLSRWFAAQQDPLQALEQSWWRSHAELAPRVAAQLLKSAARLDAATAAQHWQQLANAGLAGPDQLRGLMHRAARADAPGIDVLVRLAIDKAADKKVLAQGLEYAIRGHHFELAAELAAYRLPGVAATRAQRYWGLRLRQLGGESVDFSPLLDDDDYYAWAAAYYGGKAFAPSWRTETADAAVLKRWQGDAELRKAGEWLALGFPASARRIWRGVTKRANNDADRIALASIAQSWGWHERAVATHGCKGLSGAPSLCYPQPYGAQVATATAAHAVAPELVYAIMRQESRYGWDLGSSAGAQGLMQLMPSTAQWMAEKLGQNYRRSQILLPPTNIDLGTAYLAWLTGRSDFLVEQVAGYNAGPGNVRKWAVEQPTPRDVWIASIGFDETRNYARRVVANRLNYCVIAGGDCAAVATRLFAGAVPK